MNLHGIVAPYVGAVNPLAPVSIQVSTGPSAPSADGTQTPTYADPVTVSGQIQPITSGDLQQLDGINLGGVRWKIYINGNIDGINRPERKGGDLITISTGPHQGVWLTVQILESWPDWCVAAIVQQNDGS